MEQATRTDVAQVRHTVEETMVRVKSQDQVMVMDHTLITSNMGVPRNRLRQGRDKRRSSAVQAVSRGSCCGRTREVGTGGTNGPPPSRTGGAGAYDHRRRVE